MFLGKIALSAIAMAAGLAFAPASMAAETFSLWVRSDNANFMTPVVKAYNASHQNHAKLDIVVANQLVQKFATATAAGSGPDALSVDLIYTPAFAAGGQFLDITDWAKSLPYFDKLSKAHIHLGTYNGRIYALPYSAEASFLIYNKKLFKEAGLDPNVPPKTWDDITNAAEKVTALGNGKHGFYTAFGNGGFQVFTFTPLIWANGGEVLSEDGQTATLDTPQMRAAIAFYRNLVKKGLVPAGAQTDAGQNLLTDFTQGKIAISPGGAFYIGILTNQYPSIDFGVTPIPSTDGTKTASFAGGDNIAIVKGTKKEAEVKEFIEWCYSLEGQKIMAAHGSLPVRSDIAKEALAGQDPRYELAVKMMEIGKTPYSVVENDLFNSNNGAWTQVIGKAVYSDTPIDQVLKDGQAAFDKIINGAKAKN